MTDREWNIYGRGYRYGYGNGAEAMCFCRTYDAAIETINLHNSADHLETVRKEGLVTNDEDVTLFEKGFEDGKTCLLNMAAILKKADEENKLKYSEEEANNEQGQ